MKIVIGGCRYYENYEEAKIFIDFCLEQIGDESRVTVISGGSSGADAIGECYASEKGFAVERYSAEWKRYGRAAGPLRNKEMIKACDLVICFWDGRSKGTGNLIDGAKKEGKKVFIKYI